MASSRDRARTGRSRRRRRSWRRRSAGFAGAALVTASLLSAAAARAEIRITLQNGFIDKYKDRATIDATYSIDRTRARPSPPASDGDLDAAGRAPEIGLAAVAGVMNAAQQPEAVELVRQAERSHQPVAVRGVWRLWCEHGGDSEHVQGQPLEPLKTANPPHVFAIHPVLRLGDRDLAGSLQPIAGLAYEDAAQAFRGFEQLPGRITAGAGITTITTRMAGAEYVDFVIRLNEEPTRVLADGLAVRAAILDAQGDLLVDERRMIAVAGTAPYARLRKLHRGDSLHVAGLPRIDLALLAWRVANSGKAPGVLDGSLPYEMVLVAVLPDLARDSARDSDPALPGSPGPAGTAAAGTPAAATAAGTAGAPATRPDGAGVLPIEPLAPAVPTAPAVPAVPANLPDSDVVAILLNLLEQNLPPGAVRGACTLSTRQRSYCATLSGSQCAQLGGAFSATEKCPPADPAASSAPRDPAPAADPAAEPSPGVSGPGSRS
jgi:hypothetical protein